MARLVVLGKSGTGKSWKLGEYLESVVPKFDFAVHYDLENEEPGLCVNGLDGSPPVFRTFYIDQEAYEGKFDLAATIRHNRKLRIVPDGLTTDEMTDVFSQICEVAMEITGNSDANFHLSVDEAHNVIPDGAIDDHISRAVTGGRKRGLEWAASTQRAAKLHEDVLSQANWGVYFQLTADSDLYKVDGSVDAFSAHKELPRLNARECLIEDKSAGTWSKVSTDAEQRAHPHMAEDDGTADEFLAQNAEEGEFHDPSETDDEEAAS